MNAETQITDYLREKYNPLAILLYGSYAEGLNDPFSDFDCMLIVDHKEHNHDDSVIGGVQLDCFIYTQEETETENADTFLPAYDAIIIEDNGPGKALKARVRDYVKANTDIGEEEKEFIVSWIRKTMKRMQKADDEGSLRAVAFMSESLADYYLLRDMFYFGSKKAVRYLKASDEKGYELFHRAVSERSDEAVAAWAEHVISR